jgi:hypothetical protein
MPRYTDEAILTAAAQADSVYGAMRIPNMRLTGGSHGHLKRRMLHLGIDVAGMTRSGRASNKGKKFPQAVRSAESILVLRTSGRRQYAKYLKRALIEIGRAYCCELCGNKGEWMGKPLTLQIDHRDRNWLDDRAENLRFVCPNCHGTV